MRLFLVVLLSAIVIQPPQPVIATVNGFACKTPELWEEFSRAITESDNNTIRNIQLAQRCVPIRTGELTVLSSKGEYLLIEANARRQLYIPKWYTIQ